LDFREKTATPQPHKVPAKDMHGGKAYSLLLNKNEILIDMKITMYKPNKHEKQGNMNQ
jgi:hypothetical protein